MRHDGLNMPACMCRPAEGNSCPPAPRSEVLAPDVYAIVMHGPHATIKWVGRMKRTGSRASDTVVEPRRGPGAWLKQRRVSVAGAGVRIKSSVRETVKRFPWPRMTPLLRAGGRIRLEGGLGGCCGLSAGRGGLLEHYRPRHPADSRHSLAGIRRHA